MSQADVYATPVLAAAPLASTIAATDAGLRGAIARAAQATGVDFSYLLAQARLESSLDPGAHASNSSAAGLYQFTKGTWTTMLARHGGALGSIASVPAAGPSGGANPSPASRAALMALRYDPDSAARMAAEFAADNAAVLTQALGRAPTPSELYLAHFLGPAGATRFLGALAADPGQSAAALLPRPAAANRAIFFDASGAGRSLGQVMALIDGRMVAALQASAAPQPPDAAYISWPDAGFDPAIAPTAPAAGQAGNTTPDAISPPAASMAQTLRTTFSLADDLAGGAGRAPDFVRSVYERMQAWGL